ncbi:unnamed protein product [Choristocarpus tenellus]
MSELSSWWCCIQTQKRRGYRLFLRTQSICILTILCRVYIPATAFQTHQRAFGVHTLMVPTSPPTCRTSVAMTWGSFLKRGGKGEEEKILTAKSRVRLGDLSVSPMGIGTWAWGNKVVWGYDEGMDNELQEAFNLCLSQGINWFDTADSYGTGKIVGQAERLLGKFLNEYPGATKVREGVQIATKFAPYPYRIGRDSIVKACDETLERMEIESLGVGQLHWAPPFGWQEKAYWQGLTELRATGRVREVGLSNYGPEKLFQAHRFLADEGAPLASNQVQFSLVSRYPLENGLFEAADQLGVTKIAYSPLALGLLTGKYGMDNIPSGPRGIIFRRVLPTMGPLLGVLRAVAIDRGKTTSQVALNWCICKGTVPVVGVKSLEQAKENLGALGWRLTSAEVEELDTAARKVKNQTIQNIFQSA